MFWRKKKKQKRNPELEAANSRIKVLERSLRKAEPNARIAALERALAMRAADHAKTNQLCLSQAREIEKLKGMVR